LCLPNERSEQTLKLNSILNKFKRLLAALIGQAPGRVPTFSPTAIVLPLIEICSRKKIARK
jgi:hypothetical protein